MYVTISSDGSALRREPGGLGFESPVELFFFFSKRGEVFFFFSKKNGKYPGSSDRRFDRDQDRGFWPDRRFF